MEALNRKRLRSEGLFSGSRELERSPVVEEPIEVDMEILIMSTSQSCGSEHGKKPLRPRSLRMRPPKINGEVVLHQEEPGVVRSVGAMRPMLKEEEDLLRALTAFWKRPVR
jgi:hypothetical protein